MPTFSRAVFLGVVFAAGGDALRAQDPPLQPQPAPAAPAVPVVEVVEPDPGAAVGGGDLGWPVYPESPAAGQGCCGCRGADAPPNGVYRWLRRPLGCWASHNCPTCGSLKSECIFLFGSCRQFFGEPCLKGPPPLPPYPY